MAVGIVVMSLIMLVAGIFNRFMTSDNFWKGYWTGYAVAGGATLILAIFGMFFEGIIQINL